MTCRVKEAQGDRAEASRRGAAPDGARVPEAGPGQSVNSGDAYFPKQLREVNMGIVLYILAILWIVVGTFLVLYTESTQEVLRKLFLRDHFRWLAALPLIFGILLVVGAFYRTEMFWLVFILGVLGLLKGVFLIFGPSAQIKKLLHWWFHTASERTIRLNGLISVILGTAVLSYL